MQTSLRTLMLLPILFACQVEEVSPPPNAVEESLPVLDPAEIRRPAEEILDSFAGCYEFAQRAKSAPSGSQSIRAELRKVQASRPNSFEAVLTPGPPMPPHWSVHHGEAVFSWTDGYSGFSFRLLKGGAAPVALVGEFTDYGPKIIPTFVPVAVQRVPCGG